MYNRQCVDEVQKQVEESVTVWNEDKQKRFDELRIGEAGGTLSDAERAELEVLFAELDALEAETMRPALERQQQRQAKLQKEKEQLEASVDQLEEIVSEQEQLLADAQEYLNRLRTKRMAIADKYYQITGHSLSMSR